MKRTVAALAGVVALVLLLIWLREPGWIRNFESGLGTWQVDASGTRYRWTGGRASFFVDAVLREIRFPVRIPDQQPAWPTVLTVSVDGRTASRVEITDGEWREVSLRMPVDARRRRRLRRIDLHVDRTQPGNRGVQLGEMTTIR